MGKEGRREGTEREGGIPHKKVNVSKVNTVI